MHDLVQAGVNDAAAFLLVTGHDVGQPAGQCEHPGRHALVRVLQAVDGRDRGQRDAAQNLEGSFWLYEMPDPYPDVAYVDNLAGAVYVEDDTAVDRFRQAYDQLSAMALAGKESAALIAVAAKEL